MAIRISGAVLLAATLLAGASGCARADAKATPAPSTARPDAGGGKTAAAPKADAGSPGDRTTLPLAEVGDCPAICAKLLRCKEGPFDTMSDCSDACEGSIDDRKTAKTYRCVAKAKDCAHVKTCTK